jgi:hypothetical protein
MRAQRGEGGGRILLGENIGHVVADQVTVCCSLLGCDFRRTFRNVTSAQVCECLSSVANQRNEFKWRLYSGCTAHHKINLQNLYINNFCAPIVLILLLYLCCTISRGSSERIVNSPWDGWPRDAIRSLAEAASRPTHISCYPCSIVLLYIDLFWRTSIL